MLFLLVFPCLSISICRMKIVFSDFDGTLTFDRMLGPKIYDILDLVSSNKSEFVIVSGRSISWGHFLLTHFPMEVAIMEGGGVILLRDQKGNIQEEVLLNDDELLTLDEITIKLLHKFPQCPLSADSFGRKTDRAVEFVDQDENMINEIRAFFDEEKIPYTQSDVHINFWVGNHSKYKAIELFLLKYRPNIGLDDVIYFGDSFNDESLFQHMPNTVGVSNIQKVLSRLQYKPKTVLKGDSNIGPKGVYNYLKREVFSK